MAQLELWMSNLQRVVAGRRIALPFCLIVCCCLAVMGMNPIDPQKTYPPQTESTKQSPQPKFNQTAIQGRVTDTIGAAIARAQVTVIDGPEHNIRTTRLTDHSGAFVLPVWVVGTFDVDVEIAANGFQRLLQKNVKGTADQTTQLDVKLTPGLTQPAVEECSLRPARVSFGSSVHHPAKGELIGCIQGVITDPRGIAIANAKISVTNSDTGEVITVRSNNMGVDSITPLQANSYYVDVLAKSFQRWFSYQVEVDAYRPTKLDIKIVPLGPNEKVRDTQGADL
jgi:hypothetical protein